MSNQKKNALALAATLVAGLALAGCKPGSGANDTLADGATDRATENNGSTAAGPNGPPVDAASPAAGNAASQAPANAPGMAAATLMLAPKGAGGERITNSAGNTLYYVDGDTDGSKCTGPCLQSWPPVTITDAQPTGAPGLQGAMISTITRPDGTRQVTFNGHPLYRYAADAGAGSANGDGVKDKFGLWHVATPQIPHDMSHGAAGSATDGGTGTKPKTGG